MEYIIISIILYPIIYFSILVYTEIIELNFCGFSKNIRKKINYRTASENIDGELKVIYKENNKLPLVSKIHEISKRVEDKNKGKDVYRIDLDNNIN